MGISFRDWVSQFRENVASDPASALLHAGHAVYLGLWYTVTSRFPLGTNVYQDDWDLLIVLDACRTDVLREVRDEYDFIESVDQRWSVGSHSREWVANTFTDSYRTEIEDTVMVTANPHAHRVFDERLFPPEKTVPFGRPDWSVVEADVFRQFHSLKSDHKEGFGVPPRPVTNNAIADWRTFDPDRLVVHYMQPHIPYIGDALSDNRQPTEAERDGWKALRRGEIDASEAWDMYKQNLRLVLDEVELLLSNVDADRVRITADHGNAFGEGFVYGHPEAFLHPTVRGVPWATASATDTGQYQPPEETVSESDVDENVEGLLEDLGYR